MADQPKKPVITHVPAILTGSAALIAALTTTYINLRGDHEGSEPATSAAVESARPVASTVPATAAPAIARLRLQLDRIAVQHDGTLGTTDWRFAVEADGEPLFAFEQDSLNDEGGRNIAHPADAAAMLRIADGQYKKIAIKGWRESRFRGSSAEPDALGEGTLAADGSIAPIQAAAADPQQGAFTFYFSANPEKN